MKRMWTKKQIEDLASGGTSTDASKTAKGIVQIGDRIDVSNGVISSPMATESDYGVTTFNEVKGYVVSDLDGTTDQTITDAIAGNITNDLAIGMAVDNKITSGITSKQDKLVSGTNIKTINNTSLLGPGNIDISSGGTYTLPVATDTVLGGVKAIVKTTETSEVAVDSDGKLWATAGGSSGTQLYQHNIKVKYSSLYSFFVIVINQDNTVYDKTGLINYFNSKIATPVDGQVVAVGSVAPYFKNNQIRIPEGSILWNSSRNAWVINLHTQNINSTIADTTITNEWANVGDSIIDISECTVTDTVFAI